VFLGISALALAVAGCTAANHTGVTVGADDVPRVVNCGTWIRAVEVSDAATDRVIWQARAVESEAGVNDVGSVQLGALPNSWSEERPAAIEPRPATWRFVIETTGADAAITVTDAALGPDTVARPGARLESTSHFDEQTCSGIPVSLNTLRWIGGAALLVAVIAAAFLIRHARRRQTQLVAT